MSEIKVEKSLSKILDLELCKKQIPNNEIIIDDSNNCCINNNGYRQLTLYGNNNYGFYKINNHDIHCVKLKIQINRSHNNGFGLYF